MFFLTCVHHFMTKNRLIAMDVKIPLTAQTPDPSPFEKQVYSLNLFVHVKGIIFIFFIRHPGI